MEEIPSTYKSILIEDLSIQTQAKNALKNRGYLQLQIFEYRSRRSPWYKGLGSRA